MEPQTEFLPKNYSEFIFVLGIRFLRQLCRNHKADMLNPYEFIFTIRRSCERQSNAFDKSVRSALNDFLMSVADFHFSSIDTRQ